VFALCTPISAVWLTAAGLVDLGFTLHAVERAGQSPPSPSHDVSRVQIGLMVPQAGLSALLLGIHLAERCPDRGLPWLFYGLPAAWSLGLVLHGAWALSQPEPGATAASLSMPLLPTGSGLRVGRRF
jgi:hypothetical protein